MISKRLHVSDLPPNHLKTFPRINFAEPLASSPAFAVISDIHGNLQALESVLAFLDGKQITAIINLGDVVGYGPNPTECIHLLRDRSIISLRGNHDHYATSARIPSSFSSTANIGLRYTRRKISVADRAYLRSLPLEILLPQIAFVHSSYPSPKSWRYIHENGEALPHLLTQPRPLSFFGHTHWAGGFVITARRIGNIDPAGEVPFDLARRTCFNPGAIGQPRDHDPRASLLICKPTEALIEFHRVAYDLERAAHAILKAGLPEMFASRLKSGQ